MTNRRSGMPGLRMAAVTAAAVLMPLALSAPALAGTSAGTSATSPSAAAAHAGTVVQDSVPALTGGGTEVTTRFTATLPEGTTGPVSALIAFDPAQIPPAAYGAWRVAEQLHATCSVNGGPYQACAWAGGYPSDKDPLTAPLRLALPAADAGTTVTYDVRLSAGYGTLPADQLLSGSITLSDATGAVVATGTAQINYLKGVLPANRRGVLYARDASGVLWRYEGNDMTLTDKPFKPRVKVGGGWNAYTAVVPLGALSSSGWGDLVARDAAGVLWYYEHSNDAAQPWKPRVKVGAGWNIYTALNSTQGEVGGTFDLVARDRDGVLWEYLATNTAGGPRFEPRRRVGGGWNAYNSITDFGGGVLARDAAGVLWSYGGIENSRGLEPFSKPQKVGAGWNRYNAMSDTWIARPTSPSNYSLVARDRVGELWWYNLKVAQIPGSSTLVGSGWNIYTLLF